MKLTLTSVQRYTKDKEGNPLMAMDKKTNTKRPYTRLSIRAEEYGEKSISGFDNDQTRDWKEKDVVEADVIPNGEYLNLKLPKKEDANAKHFEEIKSTLTTVKMLLNELVIEKRKNDKPKIAGTNVDYPTSESEGIDPNDIPFE